MSVYPNPTQSDFTVHIDASENIENSQLQIIDLIGKIVMIKNTSITSGVNLIYFKRENLEMGTYLIKFIGGNSSITPIKIVLE